MNETIKVLKELYHEEDEEDRQILHTKALTHRQNRSCFLFKRKFRRDCSTRPSFGASLIYITGWHDCHYVGSVKKEFTLDMCKAWFTHYCVAIEGNSRPDYDEESEEIDVLNFIEAELWKRRRQTDYKNAWKNLCDFARRKIPGYEECNATNTNEGIQPPHVRLYVNIYPLEKGRTGRQFARKLEGIGIKHCWQTNNKKRCINKRKEGEGTKVWEREQRELNKMHEDEMARIEYAERRNERYQRRNE